MTIEFQGLSPNDQDTVKKVWSDLMIALDKQTNLNAHIDRWFGVGCPAAFRTSMPSKLQRFRSSMNLCNVVLSCAEFGRRDKDTYGAAYHNDGAGGFANIVDFNPANQPSLRLELDSKWNTGVPTYKTSTNRDSAFQTIAHELSHLLMATRDEKLNPPDSQPRCYGETICTDLAVHNDARALTNADNWGYFMEDLRG